MKAKYERTLLRPFGEETIYKSVKQYVAWCEKCDHAILGNGSVLMPYYCECKTYKFDGSSNGYIGTSITNEDNLK